MQWVHNGLVLHSFGCGYMTIHRISAPFFK